MRASRWPALGLSLLTLWGRQRVLGPPSAAAPWHEAGTAGRRPRRRRQAQSPHALLPCACRRPLPAPQCCRRTQWAALWTAARALGQVWRGRRPGAWCRAPRRRRCHRRQPLPAAQSAHRPRAPCASLAPPARHSRPGGLQGGRDEGEHSVGASAGHGPDPGNAGRSRCAHLAMRRAASRWPNLLRPETSQDDAQLNSLTCPRPLGRCDRFGEPLAHPLMPPPPAVHAATACRSRRTPFDKLGHVAQVTKTYVTRDITHCAQDGCTLPHTCLNARRRPPRQPPLPRRRPPGLRPSAPAAATRPCRSAA